MAVITFRVNSIANLALLSCLASKRAVKVPWKTNQRQNVTNT